MKRSFVYIILVLCFIILIKFFVSDYKIEYDYKDYKVNEIFKNNSFYFEIDYKGNLYNYFFNEKRGILKKKVTNIKLKKINDYICLKPEIKGIKSYYVCNDGKNSVSYQVAKDEDGYENVSDNLKYYKNLNSDEHVYIWKYDGFYYLNGDEYKSIDILNRDRYSNDLMISIKNYIVFPYYDANYLFSDFVILDMKTGEYQLLNTKYSISYDSYYAGNRKNKLYLFDNKENKLYEIDIKKNSIKLVGDINKGFIKYVNGKKKDAQLKEYSKNKITYFEDNYNNVVKINKNYLSYNFNKDISFKFFKNEDINSIISIKDNIYFVYKDKLYKYSLSEAEVIFHYFEFNFNSKNNIYVYNE